MLITEEEEARAEAWGQQELPLDLRVKLADIATDAVEQGVPVTMDFVRQYIVEQTVRQLRVVAWRNGFVGEAEELNPGDHIEVSW